MATHNDEISLAFISKFHNGFIRLVGRFNHYFTGNATLGSLFFNIFNILFGLTALG